MPVGEDDHPQRVIVLVDAARSSSTAGEDTTPAYASDRDLAADSVVEGTTGLDRAAEVGLAPRVRDGDHVQRGRRESQAVKLRLRNRRRSPRNLLDRLPGLFGFGRHGFVVFVRFVSLSFFFFPIGFVSQVGYL